MSMFGGVPVTEPPKKTSGSRFGGVAIDGASTKAPAEVPPSWQTLGSGALAGLSSVPQAMADVMMGFPSLKADIAHAISHDDKADTALRGQTLDLPGYLEREGMNAPRPSDTAGRATYDLGRNLGAAAPFAPFAGAVPVLTSAAGATAVGETAHAALPNNPDAETLGSIVGGIAGGFAGSRGTSTRGAAPTNEQLRAAGEAAFDRADQAGVVIKPEGINRVSRDVRSDLADFGYAPQLHPRIGAVLDSLDQAAQGNSTLKNVHILRRIAQNAGDSQDGGERALSGRIVGHIDHFLGSLKPSEVLVGDYKAGVQALREGITTWARVLKSEALDEVLGKADRRAASTGTGGNGDNAIRQNVRALLDNKSRARAFTTEEKGLMEKVVRGGPVQNLLRLAGRFSPTSGFLPASFGILSTTTGGPLGVAVPVLGMAAKYGAEAMTGRNAAALSDMVRRGPNAAVPVSSASRALVPAALRQPMLQPASPPGPSIVPMAPGATQDQDRSPPRRMVSPPPKRQGAMLTRPDSSRWTGQGGPLLAHPPRPRPKPQPTPPELPADYDMTNEPNYGPGVRGAREPGRYDARDITKNVHGDPMNMSDNPAARKARKADDKSAQGQGELDRLDARNSAPWFSTAPDHQNPMTWTSRGAGDQAAGDFVEIPSSVRAMRVNGLLDSMKGDYDEIARVIADTKALGETERRNRRAFNQRALEMREGNAMMNEQEGARVEEQGRAYQQRVEDNRQMIRDMIAELLAHHGRPAPDVPHSNGPRNP